MKKITLLLIIISWFSYAQKIEIGDIKSIYSSVLEETREYWIYLPKHYNDTNFSDQEYPVIYLLDGEKYFHVVSGMVKNLSNGYYPQIPECIVVGIKNIDRSRDFTPTQVDGVEYKTGGSQKFESFLTKELVPEIISNYRVLDYKIIVGHSFGGLYVVNSLFTNPNLFNGYIAIDPSLWWDDKLLIRQYEQLIDQTNFNKRRLFLADANSFGKQKTPSKRHYEHTEAKKEFIEHTTNQQPEELVFSAKFYEYEDHGSVVLPSLIDGFRAVFNGFKLHVKEVVKNPVLLQENYKNLSTNLGFEMKPQSFYIDIVVDLAIKFGNKENAITLQAINEANFPDNVYIQNKFK